MIENFPKAYEPQSVDKKWYEIWQKNNIYSASTETDKPTYSILMPPPNVTGILHFGHVLNISLQDLYIRYKRMLGYEVCWFPGYDHAGIATHAKVEAELRDEGLTRYDIGREKFLERVWQWKEKYGGIILKQLRELGISCDWNRTLFTMDESASNAVQQVFIKLFDDGLIYKGKRIINWSPLSQTALSDEEVEFKEVKEHLYTIRYYFPDSNEYLKVATVRPETLFGDVAVAVNPKDERYKHLIGKTVIVPIVGREIKLIADDYADPTFGTGCVKITPAHDANDFEVGLRHNLEMPNTFNPDGTLNELTGEFNGMDRFVARKKILEKLKEKDLIEKIEDYTHNVGFSYRGKEAVEPYLSDQWFVKMKPLAEDALKVVMDGQVRFFPNHWVKTYEHWMTNIRDWCISRQLWWGHRIPVYYTEDGKYTAANSPDEARKKLGISNNEQLRQDEDVLDTWFSSWLWPLTTMNWLHDGKSENTKELEKFLPTDLLVTAPDIIFFWVARMIMATMKFKKEIPYKDVYFTSTIRDGLGRKLSKSLGNSPDPLNIIDKYGTDAVRFTSLYLSPLGQDVKMDVDVEHQDIPSMEIGRNFANKIWNAGRFILMKQEQVNGDSPATDKMINNNSFEFSLSDKWIISRFNSTIKNVNDALDNYRVNDYTKILYDFIWRDFCDWYVEIIKVQLNGSTDSSYNQSFIKFVIILYEGILKLLHPIMPFITEEIWHLLYEHPEVESISLQRMPETSESLIDLKLEEDFEFLQSIVEEIRKLRSLLNIPPQQKTKVTISAHNHFIYEMLNTDKILIETLAKCEAVKIEKNISKPDNSIGSVIRETEVFLLLDESIDLDKERKRLNKEIDRLKRNIDGSEKKLSNEKFVGNAPEEVVLYEREKLNSMKESLKKVIINLEGLM
ncbi:MAG: valine--tRNA ligase [Bacteroidetes bacterium]|nr:MAG: valine--tRNA ligase [Bacteroidota bacterium]